MLNYFYTNEPSEFYKHVTKSDLILIKDGLFKDFKLYVPTKDTHPHFDVGFLRLIRATLIINEIPITNRIKKILDDGYKFIIVTDNYVKREASYYDLITEVFF